MVTPATSMTIAVQKPHESRAPVRSTGIEDTSLSATPALATFTFPNRILFGWGGRKVLASETARLGMTRPLVVTDSGLIANGLAMTVAGPLGKQASFFRDVAANPTEDDVLMGLERYHADGCDGLVAIGGGSALDAAKAIRLLVTHPGRLADYDLTKGGQDKITASLPPLAAVPTTAGTGSEVGRGTLIQLPQTGRKTAILSPCLLPSVAICDPELTAGLSPALTAGTGMDAFTHCVESYLSTTFHPICDGIAVEGLKYISKGLETAVRDPANVDARTAMMMGTARRNQLSQRTRRRALVVARSGRDGASSPRNA